MKNKILRRSAPQNDVIHIDQDGKTDLGSSFNIQGSRSFNEQLEIDHFQAAYLEPLLFGKRKGAKPKPACGGDDRILIVDPCNKAQWGGGRNGGLQYRLSVYREARPTLKPFKFIVMPFIQGTRKEALFRIGKF